MQLNLIVVEYDVNLCFVSTFNSINQQTESEFRSRKRCTDAYNFIHMQLLLKSRLEVYCFSVKHKSNALWINQERIFFIRESLGISILLLSNKTVDGNVLSSHSTKRHSFALNWRSPISMRIKNGFSVFIWKVTFFVNL